MSVTLICKNTTCYKVVPSSKNTGRPREFCEEACRKRYNASLYYRRQTSGKTFKGLKSVTEEGYPKVNRKKCLTAASAEKRVKEHGENCGGSGKYCQAKLHDAYNTKKMCLVRAVFTDDWLELMYEEEGKEHPREMTTKDGMWIDDHKAMLMKKGIGEGKTPDAIHAQRLVDENLRFSLAGGNRKIPEFPAKTS